jgi:hypothetical protein
MKTTYLFPKIKIVALLTGIFLFMCNYRASAQLKLYSNGNLSIGSIIQPPTNAELQIVGNTVISKNSGTINSAAYIKGLNMFSTDSIPDYSWWGDTLTGIFHPALRTTAFTNAGLETMRLSSANNILIGSKSDNGDRFQLTGSLNTNPLDIYSNFSSGSSGYSGINWVNDTNIKAWTVKYNSLDKFYVYGNGQAYSYGWNTMSDSTLKENIRGIQCALDKVLKLQGVTYNLKQSSVTVSSSGKIISYPSSAKMGLIAQAVERVVPEVVTTTSDGLKTVAYGNLVGLLIEAIKQEDTKVTKLQHELDSTIIVNQHAINASGNNVGTDKSSQAKLYPCKSCPSKDNTTIHCYIPSISSEATLLVFDMNGALKKSIAIKGREEQYVSFNDMQLSSGMYYYSLVVDGDEIGTQKIIFAE